MHQCVSWTVWPVQVFNHQSFVGDFLVKECIKLGIWHHKYLYRIFTAGYNILFLGVLRWIDRCIKRALRVRYKPILAVPYWFVQILFKEIFWCPVGHIPLEYSVRLLGQLFLFRNRHHYRWCRELVYCPHLVYLRLLRPLKIEIHV